MQVQLDAAKLKELAQQQGNELSRKLRDKINATKQDTTASASVLGLGGIPPALDTLGGVACHRIIRSHVLSFATLRQIRFGAGVDGDAACRALLAALALNGLARSDAELVLRANCDLRARSVPRVDIDRPGGERVALAALSIADADELLAAALDRAGELAGVHWDGVVLRVTGNPAIVAAAVDEEPGA
jgi:CRISPR-associated protein Csb1